MPFTQSQIQDIKQVVKDSISELLSESFISSIADNVAKKIRIDEVNTNIKKLQDNLAQHEAEIKSLQKQNQELKNRLEGAEQHSRSKNIRIYGMIEQEAEEIMEKVCGVIGSKLMLKITTDDVDQIYRVGKKSANTTRPIIVKFTNVKTRNQVLKSRKMLKNTGIVMAEDLSRDRYFLLKEAVQKLGSRNVWTMNGTVYVNLGNRKHRLRSREDLDKLD